MARGQNIRGEAGARKVALPTTEQAVGEAVGRNPLSDWDPPFRAFFADGAGHDPTIPSPIQSYSSYGIREATADNDGMSGQLFCNSRNGDCDQRVQVGTAGLWKRAAQDVSRLGSPQPRTRLLREPEDGTPLWGHPSQPLLSGAHVHQVLTPASLTHHPCGGPRPPLPPPPPQTTGRVCREGRRL